MLIRRDATIEELKALHRNAADKVEDAIYHLYGELCEMDKIGWRGSLRNGEIIKKISVTAHNIMLWSLELSRAQDDLERINKKLMKTRGAL